MDPEIIIKNNDGTYTIWHEGNPYQVCPKDIDPGGLYDIDEIAVEWEAMDDDDPNKQMEIPLDPPTEEELKEIHRAEIHTELDALDIKAVRALTTICVGTGTDADIAKVHAIEHRKDELREELRELDKPGKRAKK